MDKNKIAEMAVNKMLSEDRASKAMGMQLQNVRPGFAEVSMEIRKDMVNGHNIAHGGIVFALADTAFACACNSYNIVNLAASCHINFIRPALLGDILLAKAGELSRGRRSGVYEVRVNNQSGKLVCVFRGHSLSLDKPIFEEENK